MPAKAHKVIIPRTAHYYTLGTPGAHIEKVWIACHGYGQAAASFISKFDVLDDGKTLIIAPEALSRFYWGGFTGDVVASWMTKGDRLDEIADFCYYLQEIYEHFIPQVPDTAQVNLFGFSQGVATILRWIFQERPPFDNLILWAGTIPDELDYTPYHEYLSDKNTQFLYGTEDELITPERLEMIRKLMKAKGMTWEELSYKGKHIVVREGLLRVAKKIEKKASF